MVRSRSGDAYGCKYGLVHRSCGFTHPSNLFFSADTVVALSWRELFDTLSFKCIMTAVANVARSRQYSGSQRLCLEEQAHCNIFSGQSIEPCVDIGPCFYINRLLQEGRHERHPFLRLDRQV